VFDLNFNLPREMRYAVSKTDNIGRLLIVLCILMLVPCLVAETHRSQDDQQLKKDADVGSR
jgi:hypothetical protein